MQKVTNPKQNFLFRRAQLITASIARPDYIMQFILTCVPKTHEHRSTMRLFTAMGQPKVSLWGQAPASSGRPVNTRVSVMSVCFPSVLVLLPGKSLTWGYTFKRVQGVEISQHMKRSFHMCCVLWASTHPVWRSFLQLMNTNEATGQWQKKWSWHRFWITGRANKRLCCQKHEHAITGIHVYTCTSKNYSPHRFPLLK